MSFILTQIYVGCRRASPNLTIRCYGGSAIPPTDLSHTSRNIDASTSSTAVVFDNICRRRRSVLKFDSSKPVPESTLLSILRTTQSSPSSFNLQPYKIIVVQSDDSKSLLASAMLGSNGDRIKDAPCTAVFLAMNGMPRISSLTDKFANLY